MSTDASTGAREGDGSDQDVDADGAGDDEYAAMLERLDVAIDEAARKVDSGRVYDAENERVRIKWIRALAYAVDVRRKLTVDRDLEELSERIERLEAAGGLPGAAAPDEEARRR